MALKMSDTGTLVSGTKKAGVPKSTYINYNDVLSYENIVGLGTVVGLSVPDTAVMSVLFAKEKQEDFEAFCNEKLNRKVQEPAQEAPAAEAPQEAEAEEPAAEAPVEEVHEPGRGKRG